MKTLLILSSSLILATTTSLAGSGVGFGREIIYPTEFDVSKGSGNQMPVVSPGSFETRKTGSAIKAERVGVTGTIHEILSSDGREVAILKNRNGQRFQVATSSMFRMNGRTFKALGMNGGEYQVQDIATRKIYAFSRPANAAAPLGK